MLEEGYWRSVTEALETFCAFLEGVRSSFAARSMSVPKKPKTLGIKVCEQRSFSGEKN